MANTSLREMETLKRSYAWKDFRRGWETEAGRKEGEGEGEMAWSMKRREGPRNKTWSMWRKTLVEWLSYHPAVDHVVALGSVLAVSLRDSEGSGEWSLGAVRGIMGSGRLTRV